MRRLCFALLVSALIAAGCSAAEEETTTSSTPSTTTAGPTTTTTIPATTSTTTTVPTEPGFWDFDASLQEVPLLTGGAYPGPEWPTSLDGVAFADAVPAGLRAALVADGFAIAANADTYSPDYPLESLSGQSQFAATYGALSPYGERAVFVTTDAAYHHWHLVFDRILRETEESELLPVLENLTLGLLAASRAQSTALAGTDLEDPSLRVEEFLEALATVLELEVGPIGDRAANEVALVEEHTEWTVSPTVGGTCEPQPLASCVDYSLMTPRGHYTRTEGLERFFKGMSLLGNVGFSVGDVETMRVGLLLSRLLVADGDLTELWATIYGPTAWLVGTADDYTPYEAKEAAAAVADGLSDATLADDGAIVAIGRRLLAMRPVMIDPSRASLRPMGTRFVLDSWFYDEYLTDPGLAMRVRPSPLDLAAAFGSDRAYAIQEAAGVAAEFSEYPARIEELRELVAGRTVDDWGRTVYDGWLYALQAVWVSKDLPVFPPFMRTESWETKELTTGLGSYTELKHDTILYAKQGIAEGEAPELPPPPRHWVEPDPVAFQRLAALTRMIRDGLIDAGLMMGDDEYDPEGYSGARWETRYAAETLIEMLDRFAAIAAEELAGEPITAEDNEFLTYIGDRFSTIVQSTGYEYGFDPSPVIADIFLDPFSDSVLEVATAPPDTIYVLVPDDEGGFQIATGAVYGYYEFWGPRDARMSDEEWWDLIIADELPDRPEWWVETFD